MPRTSRSLLLLCLLAWLPAIHAHDTKEAAAAMTVAARDWLATLTPAQRAQATFPLADAERENWHYIPKHREGLPFAQMERPQRDLARTLLASGLSQQGLLEADTIISLEKVLRTIEHSDSRDDSLYYFTVFGTPGDPLGWGWRVEGHHLSVNFTIVNGHIAATPNFMGANPATVPADGAQPAKRPLATEEDLGRALVLALDETQRRTALVAERAPGDILTRADHLARPVTPAGLGYAAMTPAQQTQLRTLVGFYAGRLRPDVAEVELRKISDGGWDRLSFAWAGSLKPGEGHYYRVQSPDFIIEYDNTQNNANHIHTSWRRFDGDFGRDLLQEHYRESHPGR